MMSTPHGGPERTSLPRGTTSDTRGDRPPRRRRLALPLTAAIAGVVGIVIGAGMTSGGDVTASDEYLELAAERDELAEQVAESDDRLRTAEEEAAEAVASAEERTAELEDREAELQERESAVAAREEAVTATEERIATSQIEIGTWTVGVDIEPGTYRTAEAVTEACYWGIYRSGTNKSDIVDNDIVQGGFPSVTLSEGQDFENNCGVWVKQ